MSYITLQPPSQNFLMEINDECAIPGTMCASVMNDGSHGMFRLQVWVDRMNWPSGRVIMIGLAVGLTFITGAPCITKCPVAPASAIAHLLLQTWVRSLILLVPLLLRFSLIVFLSCFLIMVLAMISSFCRRFIILFPHLTVASESSHDSADLISVIFSMTMVLYGVGCNFVAQI